MLIENVLQELQTLLVLIMRFKKKKNQRILRTLRRSHVVSTYGVGSVYQFKNKYNSNSDSESLMLAGIEEWFQNVDDIVPEWKIYEPRLQEALGKDFFVLPPDYRKNHDNPKIANRHLPYVRFPQWHRCSACGLMEYVGKHASSDKLVCKAKSRLKDQDPKIQNNFKVCFNAKETSEPNKLIPVRFLVACEHGHIDDFPFIEWTHKNLKSKITKEPQEHILKSFGGRGGNSSILGLKFKCMTCNTDQVDIAKFFQKNSDNDNQNDKLGPGFNEIKHECSGSRPWIGENEHNCKAKQHVLLKGASNIYYPTIKSSIFIPVITEEFDKEILNKINNEIFWNSIKDQNEEMLNTILTTVVSDTSIDLDKLKLAVKKKKEGLLNQSQLEKDLENPQKIEENYRFQEYDFILNKDSTDSAELTKHKLDISEYKELESFFSDIILIDKLRETRVQTGFSRINPYEEGAGSFKQHLSSRPRKWLPAMVVNGEGIFFNFNSKALNKWLEVFRDKKLENLNYKYNEFRKKRKLHERYISSKFILLHTFAHILMNRLCFNCGYSSAALRERIYCNLYDETKEMQGVLIYTSAGDSEGTLGGLVREGEPLNLRKTIYEAISKSVHCSYDPVCKQTKSQGLSGTNSSSCHACAFVSETSCEENNQLLNRSTIIGDEDSKLTGYFESLLD